MSDIAAPAARTAARRSSPEPWSSRRTLQTCLALIWLLDAALQFQPYIFSGNFVTKIIEPAAAGDPAVVAAPVTWSAGAGIFAGQLARPALILAVLLGLLFWVAEGFGGLTTGQATDPNSGPLLILLAACFWPPRQPRERPGNP